MDSFGSHLGLLWVTFSGLWRSFSLLWGALGSFGDPWGFLGRSWATRGRFPGFSGKFREVFWLDFGMVFGVFSLFCWTLFNGLGGHFGRLLGAFGEPKAVQKSVLFSVRFFLGGGRLTYDRREVGGRSPAVKTATDPPGAAPLLREKRDITTQGSHNDPMIA